MAQGLGAFTEGFGAGYTGVQKSRQRKRINKALDLEIAEGTLKRQGKLSRANLFRKRAEEEEFVDYAGDLKPTIGEKMLGFFGQQAKKVGAAVGGAIGFGGQQQPPPTSAIPAPQIIPIDPQQPQPEQPAPLAIKDGGAVRHMIKKYSSGGSVNRSYQPTPLANGGSSQIPSRQSVKGSPIGMYDNGGRALVANRSTSGNVTGRPGAMFYADGGNYSSGLHRVPQPLANGGRAIPASNTRTSANTARPLAAGGTVRALQDGGPLTEDEKALKRAKQLREQRAKTSARASAPKAPQAPIDDVAKQQRGSTAAKPAAEATPKTRKSAITGREVKAKEVKPRKTARLAELAKKGTKLGGAAALGTFLVAEKALETGAPGLGVAAHGVASAIRGQDMADVTGEGGLTPTSEYRERLGMGKGSENEALRVAGDFLARGLGTLQELGDKLTMGYGEVISDWAVRKVMGVEDDTAAQPAPDQPQTQTEQPETALPTGDPTGSPGPAAPTTDPAAQDDPEIDMAGPEMQGVMPEDMPSHSVEDWEKERYSAAAYAVTQGQDPNDAMLAIDQQQQRGFLRYLNQAQRLLVAGDGQSAARAMYAAYSYFPNGTDVRFGVTKGADGMPILMGMGKDEVTGEPVNNGKTMALTPETIAVMAENAQDPKAWRVWTKDWREMEKQIREIEEIDKPKAQQEIRTGAAREDYLRAGAQEARASALSPGTPLRESDYRGTATAINEIIWSDPDIDPEDINSLSAVGARAKRRYPDQDNMEIGAFIVKAYKDGLGPDEILDELDRLLSRR